VTATGTVEPVTQVEVGTQVSGIIDKLYADYNDQVKAGQLIAEMDKVTLQAELESAQAQLASR
jgi:HlyD family secretion protein